MSDETERKEVASRMCSRLSVRVKEIDRDGACVCVCFREIEMRYLCVCVWVFVTVCVCVRYKDGTRVSGCLTRT